jgi:hypothetical protein
MCIFYHILVKTSRDLQKIPISIINNLYYQILEEMCKEIKRLAKNAERQRFLPIKGLGGRKTREDRKTYRGVSARTRSILQINLSIKKSLRQKYTEEIFVWNYFIVSYSSMIFFSKGTR